MRVKRIIEMLITVLGIIFVLWSAADSENYAFSEKEIIKILQEII